MEDEEIIAVVACAAVAQTMALYAASSETVSPASKKNILTVNTLRFERMLHSAACASWFEKNLRCTKTTFVRIASFLEQHGIRFAAAKVKKNSYEKKVTAALYFLGSAGGYREAGGAMGMARSYVMEITTEVVRVLTGAASAVISIPRSRQRWRAVEDEFASRHGYPGVAGAIDGSLLAIERPDKFDGFYCRKCYPALNVQAVLLRTTSS
ncbi:hypothetical protein PR003_g11407 [Phytophthora rubi]|uniref:DDE Tnp4 domain-containing protein n=1 Tax=Phytophthora rubi TaxID=129364 RepID=A0A6A4F8B5_9STRA|nr:hypothetical protein PR003_g11407 [Phytophthora rubi]